MTHETEYDHIALALCHEVNAHVGGCTCRMEMKPPCLAMLDQARRFMITIGMTTPKVKQLARKRDIKSES